MSNEFTIKKGKGITVYSLGESDGGVTGAAAVGSGSVVKPLGVVQRRSKDSIFAQEEKKEAPKPRNFVAKNAKMGGAGQHKDKKKAEKQGDVKHKKPFAEQGVAEGFDGEYDDEAGMAQSNLLTTARAVMGLLKTIKDRDNLPEWGQEKIAKAEMMLVSVWDYLQSQKAMGNDPQQGAVETLLKTKNRGHGQNKPKSGQTIHEVDDEQWDSGEDVTVTQDDQSTTYQYKGCKFNVTGDEAQGEAWWYEPGDTWREADHYNYVYDESKGINRFYNEDGQNVFNLSATNQSKVEQFVKAKAKDFVSTMVAQPNLPRMHEQGVAEDGSCKEIGESNDPYFESLKTKLEEKIKK
jgi:hypothetical protein